MPASWYSPTPGSRTVALTLAALGAAGVAGLAVRERLQPGQVEPAPAAPQALLDAVRALHDEDALASAGVLADGGAAATVVSALRVLNTAESDPLEPEATRRAAMALSHAARAASGLLGEERWRATAAALGVRAVQAVSSGDTHRIRQDAGIFRSQVLEPTQLLPVAGLDGPPEWRETAEVLFMVRLLRMSLAPGQAPTDDGLSPDERRLYLRWKVERALKARLDKRLEALAELVSLEPTYPAGAAEARIMLSDE